jgi:TonB family protein
MKTCPQCHKEYEDNLRFCLEDGAELTSSEQLQQPTESFTDDAAVVPTVSSVDTPPADTVFRPGFQPPATQGKKTSYLMPLVAGVLGIFILFLVGVGGAGWYFLRARGGDVAVANTQKIEPPPVNTDQGNLNSNTASESNLSSTNVAINTTANARPNTKIDNTNNRVPTPAASKTPRVDEPPKISVDDRPTAPAPNVPKIISGGLLNGRAISLPKPAYPPVARQAGASGAVTVQVLVDEDGRVISAHAVNGNPLLRGAAESAARGARFSPTMLSGQPVKVSGVITYNFTLN